MKDVWVCFILHDGNTDYGLMHVFSEKADADKWFDEQIDEENYMVDPAGTGTLVHKPELSIEEERAAQKMAREYLEFELTRHPELKNNESELNKEKARIMWYVRDKLIEMDDIIYNETDELRYFWHTDQHGCFTDYVMIKKSVEEPASEE